MEVHVVSIRKPLKDKLKKLVQVLLLRCIGADTIPRLEPVRLEVAMLDALARVLRGGIGLPAAHHLQWTIPPPRVDTSRPKPSTTHGTPSVTCNAASTPPSFTAAPFPMRTISVIGFWRLNSSALYRGLDWRPKPSFAVAAAT